MKALIVFVTIFTLCLDLSNGQANEDYALQRTESQIVMDSVSPTDRPYFVAYHISIALNERLRNDVTFNPVLDTIPPEKREEFSRIRTPTNFSNNLLDWTELELVPFKNGHINDSVFLSVEEGVTGGMNVCFPNGCVDPNDAGHLCCPF